MKLIATMPVRNEAWVVGLSARVALMWCDELVILNHASHDGTVEILADLQHEFVGRVHLISVPESQWDEMQHRQFMLELARAKGATHIAIVDADEILTGNLVAFEPYPWEKGGHPWIGLTAEYGEIVQLPLYNMRCAVDRYHVNGVWGQRIASVSFEDDPRLHWWQAFREQEYQHHQREPRGMALVPYKPMTQGRGGVMHLWGASERRLIAKHALYKMRDWLEHPELGLRKIDFDYSQAVYGRPPHDVPADWQFKKAPESWWAPYSHLMKYLDVKAEPWQEAECQRLYMKHGAETFAGLDLFGVL